MCDRIIHRVPDDNGVHTEGPVGLGHVRLSIIDLSELGHQPMCSHDQRFWIFFNGEIYNFVSLRISWLWIKRGDLLSCIVAHGTTNLVLAVFVFSTGQWGFW